MKKTIATILVFSSMYAFSPPNASALEVSLASIQGAQVHVVGNGAAPSASISWENVQVTTATQAGTFNFTNGNVPGGCVGELSDGFETLFVAVSGCTFSDVVVPDVGAPVSVTGQTASFAAGDDGEIQAGVPYPDPRFTDNGDRTITDHLTGLIWLKDADCDGLKIWTNALVFANNLANNQCGLTDGSQVGDWRLPNARELESLVDYGNTQPALPTGHLFLNASGSFPSWYWTSTTLDIFSQHAWFVGFFVGGVSARDKMDELLVLPVRGGLLP